MIYQTKEYMEFQAWHDGADIITAGGMPLLLKDGLAYTPNNSYGGPEHRGFYYPQFIADLKFIGAKKYLIRFSPWKINLRHFPSNKMEFSRHTVARDLTQQIKFGHGTKSSIKKSIDNGCRCGIYSGCEISYENPHIYDYFLDFHKLYIATMDRNNAEGCYKYPLVYFFKMVYALAGNIDLITVTDSDGKLIAGATFLHDQYTVHYQFSGIDIEYARLYPMERLISEACHYYRRQGKQIMHLGGGLQEDDSLHRFKKKFGNLDLEYWTARGAV